MVAAPLLVSDIQPSRGPSANQPSLPAYASALINSWPSNPISQAFFLIHAFAIGALESFPAAIKACRSRIAFMRSILVPKSRTRFCRSRPQSSQACARPRRAYWGLLRPARRSVINFEAAAPVYLQWGDCCYGAFIRRPLLPILQEFSRFEVDLELLPPTIRNRVLLGLLGDILRNDADSTAVPALRLRLMRPDFSWQALVDLATQQDVLPPLGRARPLTACSAHR
jgi:hypothetical protein